MIQQKRHFLNLIPLRAFLVLLIPVLLGSCKMQGPFYRDDQATEFTLPEGELSHSVFLLGDAGDAQKNSAFFEHLEKEIKRAGANSDVVNLGDNAYPVGLPGELNKWRTKAEEALDKQIEVYSDYEGDVYFMPGNHDWAKGRQEGLRYVRNQERYLNEAFGRQVFFPGKGCPGPEEIPLNDSLTLIIMDSQWYFYNFEKPLNEDDCGIEDEEDIFIRLEDILRRNQDKNVLIAAHHPLWSIGVHGGRFDPWLNLFPLRVLNKNLFIPLPGFIYTGGRKYFGNIQDIAHPRYRQFKERILDVTGNFENVIYASGHEHNLQYTQKEQLHHIISGAASKTSEIVHSKEAEFGLAAPGFARLDITKPGAVWLRYYAMKDEEQGFELVFSKKLYSYKIPEAEESEQTEKNLPDSVEMAPATHYLASPFKEWLLGSNYRKLWAQPVKVRVFDIGTEKGGLKPVKRGGGMQTLSVRLEAEDGKQYNLRSLDKFAAKTVPEPLQETFAAQLVQDNVSATNPYGALVAAFLAEKAGLYHTNPEIVYVPDDDRFGIYRRDVAGQLFLFEERPDEDWREAAFFGNSKNIKSTSKSIQDRLEDNDVFMNQQFVLKIRLLDMLINDWDRHGDQWRWVTNKKDGREIYEPIPRDRDNALFLNEGVIPWVAKRSWAVWRLQGLNDNHPDVRGLNFNARHFDRFFLNEPSREDWIKTAQELVNEMNDETLKEALKTMPDPVNEQYGERLLKLLQQRRNRLKDIAKEYYTVLAKEVDVYGSEDDDYFEITRHIDGKTSVEVFDIKGDDIKAVKIYSRTFYPEETNEIRLYGIADDDRFLIKGEGKKGIKVRIIPGEDEHHIVDESYVKGLKPHTWIYDAEMSSGEVISGAETRFVSPAGEPVKYNPKSFNYDITYPAFFFGYNAEDGVFLGGGFTDVNHGFNKDPYKSKHTLMANHATLTNAFNIRYRSEFINAAGRFDFILDTEFLGPNYTSNFFGYGNETSLDDFDFDDDKSFNYVRREEIRIFPSLRYRFGSGKFGLGPFFRSAALRENEGRFVTDFQNNSLSEDILDTKSHAGLKGYLEFDTRNDKTLPAEGVYWRSEASWYRGLNEKSDQFSKLNTDFRIYLSRRMNPRTVLALRFGGMMNNGAYDFIDAPNLGGKSNLRGYPANRFYGEEAVFQNTDLRIKLTDINTYYFSGQLGVFGFHDTGRVWYNEEQSAKWHRGYGGGLWMSPFGMAVITARYALSSEYEIFRVKFDFRF